MPSNTKKAPEACIDMGSSYFRLLVVEAGSGATPCRVIADEREYIGWGSFAGPGGELPPGVVEKAARAVEMLAARAAGIGAKKVKVVATNTLRQVSNAAGAAATIEAAAGLPVRVLSQEEEARLTYLSAIPGGDRGEGEEGGAVVIDTGGSSSEICWGVGSRVLGFTGIPAGAHTVLRAAGGVKGEGRARRLRMTARDLVASGLARAGGPGRPGGSLSHLPESLSGHTIYLTGGTAVSAGILLQYMRGESSGPGEGVRLTLDELRLIGRRFEAMDGGSAGRRVPLRDERLKLLPGGLALLEAVIGVTGAGSRAGLEIVNRDLRWAVIAGACRWEDTE